jgi:hypothetical protein
VNAAGNTYTDRSGNVWLADQAYTPGSWGFYGDDGTVDRGYIPIHNTKDDRIYQTERYGLSGYRFDIDDGIYDVVLHFAETYFDAPGQRIFDVHIEDQLLFDDLDVFAEAGGKDTALWKTANSVVVEDGQLQIEFARHVELPEINGIEILDSSAPNPTPTFSPPPSPTPTSSPGPSASPTPSPIPSASPTPTPILTPTPPPNPTPPPGGGTGGGSIYVPPPTSTPYPTPPPTATPEPTPTPTPTVTRTSISLEPGWNLFSFNVSPANSDVRIVFASIYGKYRIVESYDGTRTQYDPDMPIEDCTLREVNAYHGYWIDMTEAATLTVSGCLIGPTTPMPLVEGWNLVSYLSTDTLPVAEALASIEGQYTAVLGFDERALSYYPSLPEDMNTLVALEPRHGYWVKMSAAATLVYPG